MTNKTYSRAFILVSALATLLAAGCTHMIQPPKQPFAGYTPQEKLKLKIGLNITDELLKAKWEKHSMGDTWVIPIGDAIAKNAGGLARHSFEEVVAAGNGSQ